MKSKFKMPNTKAFKKAVKALGPRILHSAGGSIYRSFNEVMARSQDVFVPIDTGALKSTGKVELPEITKDKVKVRMGYGGPAAPYAIYVHEQDKNYNNGKQWKYLETPLKEGLGDIQRNLAEDVKSDAADLGSETLA